MKLIVNGKEIEYDGAPYLADFIGWWLKSTTKIATVVNNEVIVENQRKNHKLKEMDRIEILTFAGGG